MEPKFGKSFLKNEDMLKNTDKSPKESFSLKIGYEKLVVNIIFFIVLLSVVAVVGLNFLVERNISVAEQNVEQARENFQFDSIQQIDAFDRQLNSFSDLIGERRYSLFLINEISSYVSSGTVFKSMSINRVPNGYEVTVSAISDSLSDYLEQLTILNSGDNIFENGNVENFNIRIEGFRRIVNFNYKSLISFGDLNESIKI